jgi:tripartite-type tricarboxylate transporter receptor subunit TctC
VTHALAADDAVGNNIKAGWIALGLAGCACVTLAWGQAYPSKPLKMILPFPAGGPTDIVARALGQGLGEALGQNVVIDNRPGGGGIIAGTLAARAAGDGYTLMLGGITTFGVAPSVHKNLPFDPVRDFLPVTLATRQPIMLTTHPSLPVKTVREFIALAKARPGELNYATSGPGGSGHMAGELFRLVAGVNLVHIPYKGAPPALNELIAGQVQAMFGTMLAAVPHIRAGRVRALAVTGPQRTVALPEVMTFGEAGLRAYDASSWNGILVPAGTSRAIVDRLNIELVRVLRTPNVLDRLVQDGAAPLPSTPEEFAAFIKSEIAKWAQVVKAANIRIE